MNKRKGISLIPFLLAFFLLSSWGTIVTQAATMDIPQPVGAIYVQDFADVLTPEEEFELITLGNNLKAQTKAQVAVLTVESLDGADENEYAFEALRTYGLGDKELNNGVLLLVSTTDRKVEIATGYGLEGALPDGKIGRILDEFALPYLAKDEFNAGIINTYKELVKEVAIEYNIEMTELSKPVKKNTESGLDLPWWAVVLLVIVVVVLIVLDFKYLDGFFFHILISILPYLLNRGGGGNNGGGGGGSGGGGGAGRNF